MSEEAKKEEIKQEEPKKEEVKQEEVKKEEVKKAEPKKEEAKQEEVKKNKKINKMTLDEIKAAIDKSQKNQGNLSSKYSIELQKRKSFLESKK